MEPMINIALRAARKAGELIAKASERLDLVTVEEKDVNDFVTEIDRASEQEIIYHLQKAFPEHTILGEEGGRKVGRQPDSPYEWIIDPLDGTTNFIRGIPHFCVSIACRFQGRLEHAVVLDPIRREEFTASRGRGAQLNAKRIRVTQAKGLEGAVIGTGIPFRAEQQPHMEGYMAALQEIATKTAGIRRAGSAALDLAYVAAGRFDGFWEYGLKEWDIAAGALLVQEAGGLISDLAGGHNFMQSGNVVCGSPKCFKALLQITKPHFKNLEN